MIAKQIKGKDFYGVLAYNEKKSSRELGVLLDTTYSMEKTIDHDPRIQYSWQPSTRLGKAVYMFRWNLPLLRIHWAIRQIAYFRMDYLKGMGFDDNQY